MTQKELTLEETQRLLHMVSALEKQVNVLFKFRGQALDKISGLEKRISEFEQLRESCPIACPHKFGRNCEEEIEVTPVCSIVALRDDE